MRIYTSKLWSVFALILFCQNPLAILAQDQVKQYDEGSVYEGSFKNGLRNGLANGILSADGKIIYRAENLKVGLFKS